MIVVNDMVVGENRFLIEYEVKSLKSVDIDKIKNFFKTMITVFLDNDFVVVENYDLYKQYDINTIKIVSKHEFDKMEIIAYFIVLFFEKHKLKFNKFIIEIASDDIVRIIFDDYSIIKRNINGIIIPPFIRAKFTNFLKFYNKLFVEY